MQFTLTAIYILTTSIFAGFAISPDRTPAPKTDINPALFRPPTLKPSDTAPEMLTSPASVSPPKSFPPPGLQIIDPATTIAPIPPKPVPLPVIPIVQKPQPVLQSPPPLVMQPIVQKPTPVQQALPPPKTFTTTVQPTIQPAPPPPKSSTAAMQPIVQKPVPVQQSAPNHTSELPPCPTTPQTKKTFITAPCGTDDNCVSGCCGFSSGLCAGGVIALARDGGCGHGDAKPNRDAAIALGFDSPIISHDSIAPKTFITAPCKIDDDCTSGCCGFRSGICAGGVIALTRDGGCGHGDGVPNRNAAASLGSLVQISDGSQMTMATTVSLASVVPTTLPLPSAAGVLM